MKTGSQLFFIKRKHIGKNLNVSTVVSCLDANDFPCKVHYCPGHLLFTLPHFSCKYEVKHDKKVSTIRKLNKTGMSHGEEK